ncbi:myo-inositol-1 phosphate synthase, putative [Talaromyces stipitatus ATCC 10500]|uniref:inositol-3-phosphate synthase n=1 Tax=Talaromyces stipitatus (strain ATCC 10500 / CBS 375.48 / QM 6759 / NRRL 1006) TaxID=441959 RepID=B8LZT8_TALSN|nr:myo-inositol-1 phosphate synthase, putative [Talaromyces stipitatus ATCC 10500]EED20870.1 myo-inositol-1 phosphate synthase, putative [Talaromyces stipitatus ATCC 10500]
MSPSINSADNATSPNVEYTNEFIRTQAVYRGTEATKDESGSVIATPYEKKYEFKINRKVPRVGVMLVGLGGNNGTTVTAGIIANRLGLTWQTREGEQSANYYGSIVMGSTIKLGVDPKTGEDVNIPFHDILPMVHPNDLVVGGWDISSMNLGDAADRAAVLEPGLKNQIRKELSAIKPLPSIYYPDFIAANQGARADNILEGSKASRTHLDKIRQDIRDFKSSHNLDTVLVLWTANTERYADIISGVNETADEILQSISDGHSEIAPSTIFAVASILENAPFINGSPQNTFVPGVVDLATRHKAYIAGDDFKSGQTKMKAALVEFLVNAGIRVKSIASYNHLGNNDGYNLSAPAQFRSKEISKSNVVDDMVAANTVLYKPGEHPDHCVVIKYLPAVGDNKRALDEYYADIFLGGHQTISLFNVCEDSLLASPLILDLVILAEILTRISWRETDSSSSISDYQGFHSVLSLLSYMLKAPMTPPGVPVVNALGKQRTALTNFFRLVIGLEPESEVALQQRLP